MACSGHGGGCDRPSICDRAAGTYSGILRNCRQAQKKGSGHAGPIHRPDRTLEFGKFELGQFEFQQFQPDQYQPQQRQPHEFRGFY